MEPIEIQSAEELLEILKQDVGEGEIFEICKRDAKAKFKTFTKYVLNQNNNSNNDNIKEMFSKALTEMEFTNDKTSNILDVCNSIKGFQIVGSIFNVLNLCATAAGFYILNKKVEQIGTKIDNVISVLKDNNSIQTSYKYREIQMMYSDLQDHKRRGLGFSEQSYTRLINMEYNFLELLIEIYNKELYTTKEDIYALMMMVVEMMYNTEILFDEEYFFENKDKIKGKEYFHLSHKIWDSVYDKLLKKDFIYSIFDYVFLDKGCSSLEADEFVAYFIYKCKTANESIKLNQIKLIAINDINKYKMIKEDENAIVSQNIQDALIENDLYDTDPDAFKEVVSLARECGY